jgi:hypothetical protein
MSTIPLATILDRIRDHVIASIPGSLLSPQMFDVKTNPGGPNFVKMISFGMAGSRNTDLMRPRNDERLDHAVRIGICERMKMHDQYATMAALLVRVEAITSVMSDKAALTGMRVSFVDATYPISPNREYQLGLINFNVRANMHVIF